MAVELEADQAVQARPEDDAVQADLRRQVLPSRLVEGFQAALMGTAGLGLLAAVAAAVVLGRRRPTARGGETPEPAFVAPEPQAPMQEAG